ncbi:MAG: Ig-like domain-containing protein [Thermoplasmata archaeon]
MKKQRRRKEMAEKGYVECGYCNELVKPKAMRCPHCGKLYSSGKQVLVMLITIATAISLVAVYFLMPGYSGYEPSGENPIVVSAFPTGVSVSTTSSISVDFDREMDRDSVESAFSISPFVSGTHSWSGNTLTYHPSQELAAGASYTVTIGSGALDRFGNPLDSGVYKWYFSTQSSDGTATLRAIGTGSDDFWSRSTAHPSWAASAVQAKPVLIFTHSEGCAPCVTQTGINENVYTKYQNHITYYDLLSGTDEPQATDTFGAYDPDGAPHYVPLTTVLTIGPNNAIIWHSWEGVVDEATLSSWIDDAIAYHNANG